jgi:DNA-binding transcriptional regulator YdaS (Cro superfamily)
MKSKTAVKLAVARACKAAGNASVLARELGIKVQSIQGWQRIPAERVADVERITRIPRNELRPDIFDKAAA